MSSPDTLLQTAIRSRLIASPALTALVPAANIRAGSIRPETFPAIVLAAPATEILGRAGNQHLAAELDALLHLWARDDDGETAQQIGAGVVLALLDAPKADGIWFDRWSRPRLTWVADPLNQALHGAVALSCTARWRASQ